MRNCWRRRATPHARGEFGDLLRILDGEIRLITPTDPEGIETERGQSQHAGREILPTDPRLPRAVAPGVADPQAEGDPAGPGGAAAGGTLGARGTPSPRTASCRRSGNG